MRFRPLIYPHETINIFSRKMLAVSTIFLNFETTLSKLHFSCQLFVVDFCIFLSQHIKYVQYKIRFVASSIFYYLLFLHFNITSWIGNARHLDYTINIDSSFEKISDSQKNGHSTSVHLVVDISNETYSIRIFIILN